MTLTLHASFARLQTSAAREAQSCLRANLRAIARTQPRLIDALDPVEDVEFVYGRDGALTARIANGWWSRCSVPHLAAKALLKQLELRGAIACFLAPTHASQIRVALDTLRPEQGIVAVVPKSADASLLLHCIDFSRDISAHRLWFVAGDAWQRDLAALFDDQIGLATPTQFIRVAVSGEDIVASMIEHAQKTFSEIAAKRSAAMEEISRAASTHVAPRNGPVCVVAPSHFRLWNDVGGALLEATNDFAARVHFDPDDPACSSPLALAKLTRDCSAIVTANTSRADLPGIVPNATLWLTWLTTPRIPASSGANDHLLVADPRSVERATALGWARDRVHIATWPASPRPRAGNKAIGIIVDTHSTEQPKELSDYSSHGLLWNLIREELARDPFLLCDDVAEYLSETMRRFNIADAGFPRSLFIDRLIVPAYQQGIAKLLLSAGAPVRLFGRGWDEMEEFRSRAVGQINSRESFHRALDSVSVLVNVWPVDWAHPSEFTGLPVIARQARRHQLVIAAKLALAGKSPTEAAAFPTLANSLISQLLRSG